MIRFVSKLAFRPQDGALGGREVSLQPDLKVEHSPCWEGGTGPAEEEEREPRHAGSGPKHLHMSLLGRRVLGNLRLSHTF